MIGQAPRKPAPKRGGGLALLPLDGFRGRLSSEPEFDDSKAVALVALDRALARLEKHSARQSRIVECRFFGGMSIEETAGALGISPATVKREWVVARAWLFREIQEDLR